MPVVSIALIRGRATGNGSEIALACDMSFASREKTRLSQWEVGVGLVAGGGPMARLPRQMGRQRALEVLLSSHDIGGDQAAAYGYVNRSLPDAELDGFVDALARRIASFDKWAIANTKRLVERRQPAAGCRDRRRLGSLHDLDRSAMRRKASSRHYLSRAFIGPETRKIGWGSIWADSAEKVEARRLTSFYQPSSERIPPWICSKLREKYRRPCRSAVSPRQSARCCLRDRCSRQHRS